MKKLGAEEIVRQLAAISDWWRDMNELIDLGKRAREWVADNPLGTCVCRPIVGASDATTLSMCGYCGGTKDCHYVATDSQRET